MTLTSYQRGTVFASRHGSGEVPRVLALHGWGRDRTDFDAVLAGWDAVALDLPGFGVSPPPPEAWTPGDYAERAVAPVLGELPEPVIVVGHSFGGRVAVHLAAGAAADRVAGLVLVGVPLLRLAAPGKPSLRYRLLRAAHRAGLFSDERMEAARRRHGSRDYRTASPLMRQVLVRAVNETYEEQLGRLAWPTELLWGEDDAEVPVAVAAAAAAAAPPARLTIVPGAGHLLPVTHPAEVRAAVERVAG